MKRTQILLIAVLYAGIFLFLQTKKLTAEENVDFSFGIGIPELINAGIRYQIYQFQFGVSAGTIPLSNESLSSYSADFYHHIAGTSKFSKLKTWYYRLGLNYLRDETKNFIDEFIYTDLRFGKTFFYSSKFGINIDGGIMIQLNKTRTVKQASNGWNINPEFHILPSLGLNLFYRF